MADEKVVLPMVGKIIKVKVKTGDKVNKGDTVITFESMKLEMPLPAPAAGTVKEIKVAEGAVVEAEEVVMIIET